MATAAIPLPAHAHRIHIQGQVQGVGFRPFVYRMAIELELVGRVFNRGADVIIEAGGSWTALQQFEQRLQQQAPSLSHIQRFDSQSFEPSQLTEISEFFIDHSDRSDDAGLSITVDTAPCADCLAEMADRHNRRYHYPFTNCTQCGPRYTLIRELPYDRPNTSMAEFQLCDACGAEYQGPADRRFHAQPNACPACGPSLSLVVTESGGEQRQLTGSDSELLAQVIQRLWQGDIVAIKGVGGFHLVCDATNAAAVANLRQRKHRPAKPFAVMVANHDQARVWGKLSGYAGKQLMAPGAPVVLVPQGGAARAFHNDSLQQLAPGLDAIGLMLPQSPLHWLLFEIARTELDCPELALVMTSANLSGEPLITDNQQALDQLAGIADAWLLHNRDIETRNDDSVVACLTERAPLVQRIGRGFAPLSLSLLPARNTAGEERPLPSVLALGSFLKNTIALNSQQQVAISQHIGDLDHPDNCALLEHTARRWLQLMKVTPDAIVCDLHPEGFGALLGRKLAAELDIPLLEIPHHQAHIASVLADRGWRPEQPIMGLALDGFGLGWDGEARGGECLLINGAEFQHLGSLSALALPGGDAASREPWRLTAAVLFELGLSTEEVLATGLSVPSERALAMLKLQMQKNINCPRTTSAGRWFDAVAGLLGIGAELIDPDGDPLRQSYEGEAAMRLEALAREGLETASEYEFGDECHAAASSSGTTDLNLYPLFSQLLDGLKTGGSRTQLAAQFHLQLASMLADWLVQQLHTQRAKGAELPRAVVLSGGCFQNALLRHQLQTRLEQQSIKVLLPTRVPLNDAGLSLGQLWLATQQLSDQ